MKRDNCEYSVQSTVLFLHDHFFLALPCLEAFTTLILVAYFQGISGDCDFETHDEMC